MTQSVVRLNVPCLVLMSATRFPTIHTKDTVRPQIYGQNTVKPQAKGPFTLALAIAIPKSGFLAIAVLTKKMGYLPIP